MGIHSKIRKLLADYLRSKGFIELPPVILSPITDPLNHPTAAAQVKCYGKTYQLMQSMIFHKQIAMLYLDKIFVFSPNIRIEPSCFRRTGRHLFEFTQLDVEVRNADREEVMKLCEEMIVNVIKSIKREDGDKLEFLKRRLIIPDPPFKRITYKEVYKKYGKKFEIIVSKKADAPVWIVDIPIDAREFYDREDPNNPGFLRDMDLIYPEGYGEALSGGEREYIYERILYRIRKKNMDISRFKEYLRIAKKGLYPSAGFGLGIERFTRFICGLKRIEDTTLFPKIPGRLCL
ncbi:MAG TPA: asparagine synthetase [Thermoplasmatales archaeon]|nr:asparagine synthetase [Thermoplasmatales archaeon]